MDGLVAVRVMEVKMRICRATPLLVMAGCTGSWVYPLNWPDHEGLKVLETTSYVRVLAEPKDIESGTWEPFLDNADLHAEAILSALEVARADKVDLYVHGSCFDLPTTPETECWERMGNTTGPQTIDLWISGWYLGQVDDQMDLFRHEYAHAVTRQKDLACPRSFQNEGLADWLRFTGLAIIDDRDSRAAVMDELIDEVGSADAWIPISDLLTNADFAHQLSEQNVRSQAYRQGAAFTSYLVDKGGLKKFERFHRESCWSSERSFRRVLDDFYGVELETIDHALRDALEAGEW